MTGTSTSSSFSTCATPFPDRRIEVPEETRLAFPGLDWRKMFHSARLTAGGCQVPSSTAGSGQ